MTVRIRADALPHARHDYERALRGMIGVIVDLVHNDPVLRLWRIEVSGMGRADLFEDEFDLLDSDLGEG